MSRRYALAALAGVALFVGGWAVAQPGPAAVKPGPEVPGRYAVTATPTGAVLVDTATGQTWVLRPGLDGPTGMAVPPAWEPAHRLDTPEAADKWKEMERKRRHELERAKVAK
jgi:hypothetical protein